MNWVFLLEREVIKRDDTLVNIMKFLKLSPFVPAAFIFSNWTIFAEYEEENFTEWDWSKIAIILKAFFLLHENWALWYEQILPTASSYSNGKHSREIQIVILRSHLRSVVVCYDLNELTRFKNKRNLQNVINSFFAINVKNIQK